MVNLPIVGNLPVTAKGFSIDFQVGVDGFPGSLIAPVFALVSIGFLPTYNHTTVYGSHELKSYLELNIYLYLHALLHKLGQLMSTIPPYFL